MIEILCAFFLLPFLSCCSAAFETTARNSGRNILYATRQRKSQGCSLLEVGTGSHRERSITLTPHKRNEEELSDENTGVQDGRNSVNTDSTITVSRNNGMRREEQISQKRHQMLYVTGADNLTENTESLDLARYGLRLDGLEAYVVISILTGSTSYLSLEKMVPRVSAGFSWFDAAALTTSAFSALCGLYSAVVFSLCVLYGRTAVGVDRDEAYEKFMEQTLPQRFRAFLAFVASMMLFFVEVMLMVRDRIPYECRVPLFLASIAFTLFGYSEWTYIIDQAKPIFRNKWPWKKK